MSLTEVIILIISILLALVAGTLIGYFLRVKHHEKSLENSKREAENIIEEG